MNQDFFTNLPSLIIINILARLPIPTIVRCKCVCKPWLDLLESHEFIEHHLSKSAPGLAIFQQEMSSKLYKIYEFEDDIDLDLDHDRHYNLVTNFKLPFDGLIQGSANGFLLLRDLRPQPNSLFICNPITCEYTEIHCPHEFNYAYPQVVSYGFGASKITGQHKVVRVFHDYTHDKDTSILLGNSKFDCQVYTLGTGSWRSISPGALFTYNCRSIGAFLNGNLHWLVFDSNAKHMIISCFDLETEEFRAFSPPPPCRGGILGDVFALGDNLCVCDNSSDDETVIWLMKEYGDEESWTKEYVINKIGDRSGEWYVVIRPIKVFKDGDILMAWEDFFLFYSSSETRTITEIQMFEARRFGAIDSILHTSSFLSLKSLGMENVSSF